MPKQRSTCTRCSQRRQKCDRKTPCSRCVQNSEGHLCTTQWTENYDPLVHRRYPRKPSSARPSAVGSSETSSTLNGSPSGALPEQSTADPKDINSSAKTNLADPINGPGFSIGQSKFLDISIGSLLDEKDVPSANLGPFDQSLTWVRSAGKQMDESNRVGGFCSPVAKAIETQHIQSLLPSKEMVLTITEYYYECMLYWTCGIYHGPSFRRKLVEAYDSSSNLDLQKLDWRWTALLFAILSSGMIASPEALSLSWGYSIDDKVRLSRDWGAASVTCLNLGSYTSQYHVCSIQAVYVLHAYEHLVGSTNQWAALRSVAIVIAKGLGLHKLGAHPDDRNIAELTGDKKQAFIDREIGRRIWTTMATQEWLCSTIQSRYTSSIQKQQFACAPPIDVEEETMQPMDEGTPSFTLVGRYLYNYASLIFDFHNAMFDIMEADDATRYATILKYDGELRATGVEKMPKAFSLRTPLSPAWPKWTKWSRRLHQTSLSHKIIMIHQSFISKSFKDVRYTYTRWACTTAAKNIIGLYQTRDPEEPQWWVEQAFVVTAGICLIIDLFHRPASDTEAEEHQVCVQNTIHYLQQFSTSSVALHGVRLLLSLLQEYNKLHEGTRPQTTSTKFCSSMSANLTDMQADEAVQASYDHCLPSNPAVALSNEEAAQFNFDIDTIAFEDLMDYLPTEGGIDNNVVFDSIYGLSTGQFA